LPPPPLLLPDDEDDDEEEEDDVPLDPELLLELELLESPQNDVLARPHAKSDPLHAPSTHAAARYELDVPQLQQVGLQSAYVEQLAPALLVPLSFSGFEGHAPFVCSALDDTLLLFELPLDEELLLLAPFGSVGFDPVPTESVPPLHAETRSSMLPVNKPTIEAPPTPKPTRAMFDSPFVRQKVATSPSHATSPEEEDCAPPSQAAYLPFLPRTGARSTVNPAHFTRTQRAGWAR